MDLRLCTLSVSYTHLQEAEDFAPESGIDFDPIVDTSKKIVKELKDQGAEMIICLSHSGTNAVSYTHLCLRSEKVSVV